MLLLDGKEVSKSIYQYIKDSKITRRLKLVVILVGDKEDSKVYVNMKQRKCQEYDIDVDVINYEKDTSKETIIKAIKQYNNDSSVN